MLYYYLKVTNFNLFHPSVSRFRLTSNVETNAPNTPQMIIFYLNFYIVVKSFTTVYSRILMVISKRTQWR